MVLKFGILFFCPPCPLVRIFLYTMPKIQRSFKKCSISNAMDGSEDDLFGQNEEEIDENKRYR